MERTTCMYKEVVFGDKCCLFFLQFILILYCEIKINYYLCSTENNQGTPPPLFQSEGQENENSN